MVSLIKNFLKYVLPLPANSLLREIYELKKEIFSLRKEIINLEKDILDTKDDIHNLGENIFASEYKQQKQIAEIRDYLEKQIGLRLINCSRYASEAVWAEIFNNTISGSNWLKNTAFSPGRWAVGYQYLYVMYRILNETNPKRILELGLGQSTKMISQYALAHDDITHIVIEHDEEWVNFFKMNCDVSDCTEIIMLEREMVTYKEADAVRAFKDFEKTVSGRKFDFISIDAPLGGDMKQYARIDILSILPKCLGEDFVIMIDDTERSGERKTIVEIEQCLKESNIRYCCGTYSGKKDCVLICAEHMSFLTSM